MTGLLKNVLAAIVGYVGMAFAVFALFSLLWMILGPSGSFSPGSWEVSGVWAAGSVVVGLLAAYLGGLACARLAHDRKAVWILIGIVVALGVYTALIPMEVAAGPRPDEVSMMEATTSARQPGWLTWLNPVLGVLGVWFGSRRLRA
jgi:hypothetical protein